MSPADWISFLTTQIWSVPLLIAYLCGIGLALSRWQRHPQVSLLATSGFLVFSIGLLLSAALQFWQMSAIRQGMPAQQLGAIFAMVGGVRTLLSVVGWILIISAIFGWRTQYADNQGSRFAG